MWGRWSLRTVVMAGAAIAGLVLCVLPPAYMFWQAIGAVTFERTVILDARQLRLLLTTTLIGTLTSVCATLMGAPLGLALARIELPCKGVLRLALLAPAVVPSYVLALAWTYLGLPATYSLGGAVAVLTVAMYPLSMLATEVGLRRVEARLEEAAALAASPWRVVLGISVPLAAPWVLAAALLIFVLTISEFSVPAVLRVRVFTTEVFTAFAARYDFAEATALSLPLLAAGAAAGAGAGALLRGRLVATRRGQRTTTPAVFDRWRWVALGTMALVSGLTLLLPVTVLAREALQADSILAVVSGSRQAVLNSVGFAAAGATVLTLLGGCLGYAGARMPPRAGGALDLLAVVLFAVPATVIGIGLIGLWNRPGTAAVYGTTSMLLVGYAARFLPVTVLTMAASVRSIAVSHEEAAATAGASWVRTMHGVVLPQAAPGLLATWVVAFVLAFGEIGTSLLIAPPGETTLPIRVYTLIANAPPGHVAVLALGQALVVLTPLVALSIAFPGSRARP